MKKILSSSLLLVALAFVAACGQKGPLYLPGAAPNTAASQPQQP